MHNPNIEHGAELLVQRWRRARAAYRMANLATHHVLGFAIKTVLLAYFLLALVFLFLRYAILPNIDYYKGDIERLASRAVGNPVTIERIYASWKGLRPSFFLGDVRVRDGAGRNALRLPSVQGTLSWWTLVALEPRFDSLEIIRPDLDVRRARDGSVYVAGIRVAAGAGGGGGGAWALRQHALLVREGQVRWTDEQRGAAALRLDAVTLVLQNAWTRHRFALRATPPAALGRPLDVRASFTHPRFATNIADARLWTGELYADLRDTDLTAWKAYLDFPFELSRGYGSVRAWIALDHARLAGFTADVGLANVAARLGTGLPPLALARMHGRVSAREEFDRRTEGDGVPTFGAGGHTVTLTDLALQLPDGAPLAPMSMSETWKPAHGRAPEATQVSARMLDLATLAQLAAQLPLSAPQRQMLADFAPRGQLVDFFASWDGRYPRLGSYRVRGKVRALALNAQPARLAQPAAHGQAAVSAAPAIPGFANLTGSVDATDQGGTIALDSSRLELQLPGYLAAAALPFDRFALAARWSFEPHDQLRVKVDDLQFARGALHGTLKGSDLLPLAGGHGAGTVDLEATVDGFALERVGDYLPLQTPPHLRAWLTGALAGGTLNEATVRLRGDLAHFPFADAASRGKGEFHAEGKLAGARLNYVPGATGRAGQGPLWPLAEQIDGRIVFDGARLEVDAAQARTLGVGLADVKAVVPDLRSPDRVLDIDGSAAGPLQEFLNYVVASPVGGWIGNFTDQARGSGPARLGLKLHIPLAHAHDTRVAGALVLQQDELALFPELPPVQAAAGRIEFNERGVNLPNLGGTFLGGALTVAGGTQRDGAVVVRLGGSVTAEGLRGASAVPALQRLAPRVSGAARFTGQVAVREHRVQVTVDSNLVGAGLDLPAPLRKAAADPLPLHFAQTSLPGGDELARDELRLNLGTLVQARYLRERRGGGPWTVTRGGIGVNNPAPEPDAGLHLNVSLAALDVDQWTELGRQLGGAGGTEGGGRPGASAGLAQYVVPDVMAARATTLVLGRRQLDDVVVGASHGAGTWQASIDARQIEGYLTWNEGPGGQSLGKVTARLAKLVIPESAAGEVKELFEGGQAAPAARIPGLDVVAERFELFNKPFGRLELVASNQPAAHEWRISRLALDNPDGQLAATGRWAVREGQSLTTLNFKLGITDAGKLLDRLGFPDTLRKGKGSMEGEVSWSGLPYALDTPSLSGKLALDVGAGQFLKKDPGAAKLLGVLSLQMLPRLLKLDFHDVFSEGLAFDGITANAVIARGVVKTNNLKMHGVAATVLMDGTADIANETANLHVVVIPEFNLGTGPLVYALAVNPVVGIGSFLAQLFLRAPVMKALTYQMQVSGPWKAPVVTKLGDRESVPNPGSTP